MDRLRVAVVTGGFSFERDVSLRSGVRVAEAMEDLGHAAELVDVDDQLIGRVRDAGFDVAYIALHGRVGEDGTIQGLLDLLGLPYTGSDAAASALAWDKAIMKSVWRRSGVPTPAWVSLSADAVRDLGARRVLPQIVDRLGLPLVVKPTQGGASMGVGHVTTADELTDALMGAFRYHPVALIEQHVAGTEVAVSMVGEDLLPPVEISTTRERYDFTARYTHGVTQLHAPARLPDEVLSRCQEEARAAFAMAQCRHVARADMIVDADGVPWLLELDTCPGLTETSLLPAAAQAEGWTFTELCRRVLELALTDRRALRI